MSKRFGSYTVKLDSNTNMITINKDGMLIKGYTTSAYKSTSAFKSACSMVETYVNKLNN
tara:strand:+ start:1918 stop:2094 length:177 start_codon:yes stop_codon:yes gene_type:complete